MIYDVAVSGLGPAGTSFLKSLPGDLKVIAFDRAEFPRKKLCAGGLTPKAFSLLNRLFRGIERTVRVKVHTFKLYNGRKTILLESPKVLTYLTDRTELDYFLFSEAVKSFPDIHTGETVLSVEQQEDSVKIRTTKGSYFARILVVSDGANSRIARQLKLKRDMGFTLEADIPKNGKDEIVIDFSEFKWGYYWIFPKGEWVTAGLGEFKGSFSSLKARFSELNRKHELPVPANPTGFPIPAGRRINDVRRGRIIFLGDAGGLVDPLTGEGIYYAAASGVIAADIVKKVFETGDFKLLDLYRQKINRNFGSEFLWAKVVGTMFFKAKNFNFLVVEKSKDVGYLTANLLSGRISYKESVFKFLKLIPKSLLRL